MKANIGPYSSDLIPVSKLIDYYEKVRGLQFDFDESKYKSYDHKVIGILSKFNDILRPLNNYWCSRPRKIKVEVNYYDVWSADHTIALVVLPILKKLQEVKHGSPNVDMEDVPEHMRIPYTEENEYLHERWNWILNEIVWAFEQHADPDWEFTYIQNIEQLDMDSEDAGNGLRSIIFNRQKDPTKPAYFRDDEGIQQHRARMSNGMRLFAKYYEALWD